MNSLGGNYMRALLRHLADRGLRPGSAAHVEVRHDGDCAIWQRRPCDCEPAIESGERIDRKYEGGIR